MVTCREHRFQYGGIVMLGGILGELHEKQYCPNCGKERFVALLPAQPKKSS